MSVTFAVNSPIIGWTITCACGAATNGRLYTTHAEALSADAFNNFGCGDPYCAADPNHAEAVTVHADAPTLNVSNSNANTLLVMLSLPTADGLSGTISGIDMLGRVLVAEGCSLPDAGLPEVTLVGHDALNALQGLLGMTFDTGPSHIVGGPTVIVGGRPEGYLQDRLTVLRDIAQYAADHQLTVSWG